LRAVDDGVEPSSRAARCTRSRTWWLAPPPFITRDTVPWLRRLRTRRWQRAGARGILAADVRA
jgi:hypothetical protein